MPSAPTPEPIMFTASPADAAFSSYGFPAVEQAAHLVATVETDLVATFTHNLNNSLSVVGQDIASELSWMRLQLDYLLGVNPVSTSETDAAVAPSGSGSGSGAMTTAHDDPNQRLDSTTPQSGSGSGDGSGMGSCSCSLYNRVVQLGQATFFASEEAAMCTPDTVSIPVNVLNANSMCPAVSVDYTTQDGSATAGTDYTAESGTLSFAPGESGPEYITIPILDDGDDESVGSESFTVVLSNPVNAVLGDPSTATIDIEEGKLQAATDTLRWNPCPDSNDLASDPTNWYDVTQGFQLQKGAPGPGSGTPIQFDDYPGDSPTNDAPIIWDKSFTVTSISLNEYTGQEMLNAGVTVEALGGADQSSLSMDANSELKGEFAPNSTYKIDQNANITNMDVFGDSSAHLRIAAGTTTIASGNYTEKLGVYLEIDSGATLNHQGKCTLTLSSDASYISVYGTMNVTHGPTATQTLIDRGGSANDYIYVSGKLSYSGTRGVTDTFNVPIEVTNGGTFSVSGDPTQLGNSRLIVDGTAGTQTHSASVYLTGAGSTVQLSNEAILECDAGYFQDGGTFETYDTTICTLQMGAAGTARALMNGGGLMMNASAQQGFGELDVNGNLNFYGTYYPEIQGNASNKSDLLKVNGAMSIQDATLSIQTLGAVVAKNNWTIITANNTLQPFDTTNEKQLGLGELVSSSDYELVS